MNTHEIENILRNQRCTKGVFRGVYAKDKLPKMVQKYPAAYVVNLDDSSLPGSHWVLVYISKDRTGEYFDSYGNSPPKEIRRFLDRNSIQWTHNKRRIQSLSTTVCGAYCIVYLIRRCQQPWKRQNQILQMFTDDRWRNDVNIVKTMKKLFGINIPIIDLSMY